MIALFAFSRGLGLMWTLRTRKEKYHYVGTFAIQLAKHVGATVATTTSMAKVELVESPGADLVIDYKKAGRRRSVA